MDKEKRQARTDYKRNFNAETYDRLYPYVKKGKKAKYEECAKSLGMSLNEFIETTLDEKVEEIAGKV